MYEYILEELNNFTPEEIEDVCQFDEWARDNGLDLTPEDVARGDYAHAIRSKF